MGHDLDVLLGHVQALGSVIEVPLRQALGTPVQIGLEVLPRQITVDVQQGLLMGLHVV